MNLFARMTDALASGRSRGTVNILLAVLASLSLVCLIVVSAWNALTASCSTLLAVSLGLLAWINRKALLRSFAGVNWPKNIGGAATFLLIAGILVLLNVVVLRFKIDLDLTSNAAYSLSGQTRTVLRAIPSRVKITFFRTQVPANRQVSDVLELYRKNSRQVSLETIDPDEDPMTAGKYNLQSLPVGDQSVYSTIFLEMAGRTEKVDGLSVDFMPSYDGNYQPMVGVEKNLERKLTSALVRLQKQPKKIYFTAGHQEADILNTEKAGFSRLKTCLIQENYDVDQVYLASTAAVPADCAVLVVWGPKRAFEARELDLIRDYLKAGGRVLAAVNPGRSSGLNGLFGDWGFAFQSDFIVDKESCYWYQPTWPYVTKYGFHPITQDLNTPAVFPEVCSLELYKKAGIRVRELVSSSKTGWGETDLDARPAEFNSATDLPGPLVIGAAVERETNGVRTRIAAYGDPDFCDNAFIDAGADLDLFMNSVNWLAEKEELNGIRSRDNRQSMLMPSPAVLRLLFLLCVVLIPLFFIVFGVWSFWRKKR